VKDGTLIKRGKPTDEEDPRDCILSSRLLLLSGSKPEQILLSCFDTQDQPAQNVAREPALVPERPNNH